MGYGRTGRLRVSPCRIGRQVRECWWLSPRKNGGLLLMTRVQDERDRTIVTKLIGANNQSSAPSFIPADGCIPSVFLSSVTTKFREYQNSAYAPSFK